MGLRYSLLACTGFLALATSCTDNTAPEVSNGRIRISVSTSGGDLDDGYEVVVGPVRRVLFPNGSFILTTAAGPATVELTNVASNCAVNGSASVSVDVPRDNTADVSFLVICWATGIQISVHTTGDDVPGSYTLTLTGQAPRSVDVNSDIIVSRLEPGRYAIGLESPVLTCTTMSPSQLTVDLKPRTLVPVTFEIACAAPVRLEKIAYAVDGSVGSTRVSYVALALPDGSEQRRIAEGTSPSWSPDGKKFAYSVNECVDDYFYYDYLCVQAVRAMDPETLNSRALGAGTMPAWSPQDDVVAFVEASGSLALVPLHGGLFLRLMLPASLQATDPAWSPDGRTIAFGCNQPHGFSRLCTINKDGSGFRQLTDSTSDPALHPAWSHDGSTIVFASVGIQQTSIAKIASAGGAITRIAEGFDPAWSRDGTKVIFARSDGLFTMNPDGSDVQRVTTGRHRAPAWRP